MNCSFLLNSELLVFFTSMLPVIELRGSIPIGLACGLSIYEVFLISLLGNFLILIPIIYLLPWVVKIIKKIHPQIDSFITKFLHKTQDRHSKRMDLYGAIALIIIVAIPLPGTGGWTGALVAYIFGIPKKHSLFYIFTGITISGIIVSAISVGAFSLV